jgi:predicted amidohydrolase
VFLEQYELFDQVRAAENYRWLVSSNLVGELGGLEFFGLSQIVKSARTRRGNDRSRQPLGRPAGTVALDIDG